MQRTLNSASAKCRPRHVLGPSTNVSKCLCPWISCARFGIPSSASQRAGLNSFASAPQKRTALFIMWIGTVTSWPFVTAMLSTSCPFAARIGSESGMMSSSAACVVEFVRVSGMRARMRGRTYHTGCLTQRWVKPQRLVDDGVEVRQVVGELVPGWVASRKLQKLFAQFLLDIWLLAKLKQAPLLIKHVRKLRRGREDN